MDWQTLQPLLTDTTWVGLAFALGLSARVVGLPPLVGFLATGFALNALGVSGGEALQKISDIGITLLLFTVGLKLEIRTLVKPHVWAVASLHILLVVLIFGSSILLLAAIGTPLFANMTLAHAAILAFAFSFSSTVFVVKVLEDKAEIKSQFGKVAIAILVMQDVAAVIFLATSAGKMPSLWALALFALIPMRPVFFRLLEKSGHSELLVLFGMTLALASAEIFELTGIKGGVGALIMGLLIAHHPKASELGKTLLGFKDLFLVGFFLSVGMSGELTWVAILIALAVVPFAFVKTALFFTLMTRFRLRARSSLLASLSLNNYSEFGLVVAAFAVADGLLSVEWLTTIALAVTISIFIATPFNTRVHRLYSRYVDLFQKTEREKRIDAEVPSDLGDADIVILGMGRVGRGAYLRLSEVLEHKLVGVEENLQKVEAHRVAGINCVHGDAGDYDFWAHSGIRHKKLVLISLTNHNENLMSLELARETGFTGKMAVVSRFPDEQKELEALGCITFNLYGEAGGGFAEHVVGALDIKPA